MKGNKSAMDGIGSGKVIERYIIVHIKIHSSHEILNVVYLVVPIVTYLSTWSIMVLQEYLHSQRNMLVRRYIMVLP